MQVEKQKLVDEEIVDDVDGAETDADVLDGFEYDEDGNIIIPEVVDEEADDDDADDENDSDEDEDIDHESQDKDPDLSQDTAKDGQDKEPDTKSAEQPDEKDKEIDSLKKKSAEKDSLILEALKALGVETDDPTDGLERFLAETNGQTVEEYRKGKSEEAKVEEARQLLQRTEFEKIAKADLEEIHRNFPDTINITDIRQIENVQKFAELRDKGLTATQAYAAANIDSIKRNVATSVKQQSLNETKSHLQSAVPKSAKDTSIPMSQKDLAYWKDIFPDKSEKEIRELHQQVSKKIQ